ncbi:hypothetical protein Dsin_010596 [Dipteronia sinensis]|uniref:Uncharacterized protein n=1 Tax=Dipteronia sinensis TaxID=43782 RepID=A0AAE0ASS8_9ROSI|nr:hypothetical protein Dsin_010596 [Dipteronia sinensis]
MWVYYQSRAAAAATLIPKWAWVSWMVVIVIGILLSILWILNNWIDLYRERSCKASKKSTRKFLWFFLISFSCNIFFLDNTECQ